MSDRLLTDEREDTRDTQYRVTWREFTGYKDGEGKEIIFMSPYSSNPQEDAEALADELSNEPDEPMRAVGDVKISKRQVTPWEQVDE